MVDRARGVQCAICWHCAGLNFCLMSVLCGRTRSVSSGSAVETPPVMFVLASALGRGAPAEL